MNSKELSKGQVILYKNKVEVRLKRNMVWLSQKLIAELFDTERSVITKHIQNKRVRRKKQCARNAHS